MCLLIFVLDFVILLVNIYKKNQFLFLFLKIVDVIWLMCFLHIVSRHILTLWLDHSQAFNAFI